MFKSKLTNSSVQVPNIRKNDLRNFIFCSPCLVFCFFIGRYGYFVHRVIDLLGWTEELDTPGSLPHGLEALSQCLPYRKEQSC